MIESTYHRLTKAAEILGTDPDTVLIAASEGRIRLYWLLNRIVASELGYYDEPANPSADEVPYFWVTEDVCIKHFMYVPLDSFEAAELLKHDRITAKASALSDKESNGSWWIPQTGWALDGGGLAEEDLLVTKQTVFAKRADVKAICEKGATPSAGSVAQLPSLPERVHVSDMLAKMNQAAAKFWSNAERSIRGSHPLNAKVSAWLVLQGFSPTLAGKAATIIRPEWAPTGRKPEEH